jgi:amino acid adenylation domain-containing protein
MIMTDVPLSQIAALDPTKRARLIRALRQAALSEDIAGISRRVPSSNASPLSLAQQRLWTYQQVKPESCAYNEVSAFRLRGVLDIEILLRCLTEIIRRHEILRTRFPVANTDPVQAVDEAGPAKVLIVDLRNWAAADREHEVQRLADVETRRPFDLAQGPLVRMTLLRLDAAENILLIAAHHIVLDGWSIAVFAKELAGLYNAFSAGEPSPLADLPVQYADFALWQRDWLRSQDLSSLTQYWTEQLEGIPPPLQLPMAAARAQTEGRGERLYFDLEPEITATLRKMAEREGVTLFMILLAVFQVLLHRYSGETDILLGVPVANRRHREIEPLIGFFVNTLTIRSRLSGEPSFRSFLAQVRETVLGASECQDLPFEHVLEAARPARSPGHHPLFQIAFSYRTVAQLPALSARLTMALVKLNRVTAKFDLLLAMEDGPSGVSCHWEYDADLFDAATIRRLSGHYTTLLSSIVAEPECRISALALISEAERRELLETWNETARDYPRECCIHQLIEAQARRTPEATAVVFGTSRLSYRQLDEAAAQLADHLRRLGVGPDVLVGICLERSLEMVVAVLGVLKADGAYVPFDPGYPRQRLAQIWEDARPAVLLTRRDLAAALPAGAAQVLCLDAPETPALTPPLAAPNPVAPGNLAYVIYTSGSTGRPKGVMVTHRGLVNYLTWCVSRYELSAGTGSLVTSSLAFDATITSLFSPLLVGGKVVLLPEHDEIRALATALRSGEAFSLAKITPGQLDLLGKWLFENAQPVSCDRAIALRKLIVGGEQLMAESTANWRRHAPLTEIVNEYGPTETVVGCCIHGLSPQDATSGAVPIGQPIANVKIHLLDESLEPVPIGITGEIYIGGEGLARGYLGDPELTAAKFIPDPFDPIPGARLYRTGDLARRGRDGSMTFSGRRDGQVKMNGVRIELGEIESALLAHPEIGQTVVLAPGDRATDRRLVAYLVGRRTIGAVSDRALRQFLGERLSAQMIPTAFAWLSQLPLNPNGKVDRHALPPPDRGRHPRNGSWDRPSTDLERQIAAIWCDVLGLEEIGTSEVFFELGGHSLLLVAVQVRLQQLVGRPIPIVDLLQHPTIGALADHLGRQHREEDYGAVRWRAQQQRSAQATNPKLRIQTPALDDIPERRQ